MIQGQQRTEQVYRAIELDSASTLKDFSTDRKKYFRKYIQGEKIKEKESSAVIMGKLVETLLLEKEKFDEYFHLSSVTPPSGMMEPLVDALVQITLECTDSMTGEITESFEAMFSLAHEKSGYKLPVATVLKNFAGKDPEIYYNERLLVESKNLTVVDAASVTVAETIVDQIKNHGFLGHLFQETDEDHITTYSQLKVDGFEIDNHKLKSMLDKVIINHEERTILPIDLKCVWDVERFYYSYYLKRRAYFQTYIYRRAIQHVVETHPELKGYNCLPLHFFVCDSGAYTSPILFTTNEKDYEEAYEGFYVNDRYYPGVKETIQELQWALDTGVWNMSRNAHENMCVLELKSHLNTDSEE